MTRYLKREAQSGDRVRVEYEGAFSGGTGFGETAVDVVVPLLSGPTRVSTYYAPSTATVRVIAPEPKVGDVVTEDMDLPYRTIIEGAREDLAFRTNCSDHDQPCWNHGGDHEQLSWLLRSDMWRIVRIGGPAS